MRVAPTVIPQRLADRLVRASVREVGALVRGVPDSRLNEWAVQLADDVPRRARQDLGLGTTLARAAALLARRTGDPITLARAVRAQGHALALGARYRAALRQYTKAAAMFEAAGAQTQLAITFSGTLQTLIYLGAYEKAHALARRARGILRRAGDAVRLARLDSNVGNVYFRQDHFGRALACYQRAEVAMRALGEHQDAAIALRNMAVCLTSLSRFDEAARTYREARQFCEAHGLQLLVAEADYNIAYLHFLCGEYQRALSAYATARTVSEALGDSYHSALCDLDEAEVCLELNDHSGALRLSQDAQRAFAALGLRYERAKALAFHATALARQGDGPAALGVYARARRLFAADRNQAWVASVDLARASAMLHMGRDRDAAALARQARRGPLSSRARIHWDLLHARLALRSGHAARARSAAEAAVRRLSVHDAPTLEWQAHFVCGEACEATGDRRGAEQSYRRARRSLERQRTQLTSDELKMTFLADKLGVYENLVRLMLSARDRPHRDAAALQLIEDAKSRTLVDLLAFRAADLDARGAAARPAETVRALRHEVQAYERQISRETMRAKPDVPRMRRLHAAAESRLRRLSRALDDLRATDADLAALQTGACADVEAIRAALPPDTTLVEYYIAGGLVYGCVLAAEQLQVVALAPEQEVARILRLLRFQLAKFQLGPDYVRTFSGVLSAATHRHLQELYALVFAPLRPLVASTQLVVVPHGLLHYLPFHALFDGHHYLMEDFAVSYAPSGTVYRLCQTRPRSPHQRSLVMALADGYAPHIRTEAAEVASALPQSSLYLGREATVARLRESGRTSRYIHVATHGFFRRDNPMLSAVRLTGGDLTLADLYTLSLPADLVTLSGCGTGLSAVVGGDELVGLIRGLFFAGARSLLLTMWQVDDLSTATFMGLFYRHVVEGTSKAEAVRLAMESVRERFPHPYYWAPFVIMGHSTAEAIERKGLATDP